MSDSKKYLYRYERSYISHSLDGKISLNRFPIVKETEKGQWISIDGANKWVSKTGKKRYAYPTAEEALKSFEKRTERCIKILKAQLERAYCYRKPIILKTNLV